MCYAQGSKNGVPLTPLDQTSSFIQDQSGKYLFSSSLCGMSDLPEAKLT
jgi:hypothetical protein